MPITVFPPDVTSENFEQKIYIKGDADTDGSIRIIFEEGDSCSRIQERILGVFVDTCFTASEFISDNITVNDSLIFPDGSTQSHGATRSNDDWHVAASVFKQSFPVSTQDNEPEGVFFRQDGIKMYLIGSQNGLVYEYDLSTSWDVSTAVFLQSFDPSITNIHGIFFRQNGLQMFLLDFPADEIKEYTLTTAWDISTASFQQAFDLIAAGAGTLPHDIYFRNDGLAFYLTELGEADIEQFDMTTPWDISTATLTVEFVPGVGTFAASFKLDGTIMYIIDSSGVISEFNLTTPWLVNTAELVNKFDAGLTNVRGLFFKTDGSKLYITNESTDIVGEYNVGLAIEAPLNLKVPLNNDTVGINFIDENNIIQGALQYQDAINTMVLSSTIDILLTATDNINITSTGENIFLNSAGDIIFNDQIIIDGAGDTLLLLSSGGSGVPSIEFDDSSNVNKLLIDYNQLGNVNQITGSVETTLQTTSQSLFLTGATNVVVSANSGDISLSATGDVITFSDVLPFTDNALDLGSVSLMWANLFTQRAGIGITPVSPLHVYENTTNIGQTAGLTIEQDGTGDALLHFVLTDTENWTIGIDNSNSDIFAIRNASSLNIVAQIQIKGSGEIGLNKTPRADHCLDIDVLNINTVVALYDTKDVTIEQGNLGNGNSTDFFFNRADVGFNQSEFYLFNDNNVVAADRFFKLNYTDAGTAGGLSILRDGKVGIGTSSPSTELHVSQTGSAASIVTERTDGKFAEILAGLNFSTIGFGSTGRLQIGPVASIGSLPSNTSSLSISAVGRVGIGTVSPSAQLEVSDLTGAAEICIVGAGAEVRHQVNQEYDINYTRTAGGAIMDIRALAGDGTSSSQYRFGLSSGSTGEQSIKLFEPSSTTTQAQIGTSGLDTFFCAIPGGDFGIGTTTPTTLLDVVSTQADFVPLFGLETTGTNGARTDTFVGTRDPIGNVTASPGDIYTRVNAANSTIFVHQGLIADNSSWVDINANMANTNLTLDGTRVHELDNNPFIIEEAGSVLLDLSAGQAQIRFNDNVLHADSTGLQLNTEAGSEIQLISAGADTEAIFGIETTGTNGAEVFNFVGDRDPTSNVTGSPGDLYRSKDGAASSPYFHAGTSANVDDWRKVEANPENVVEVFSLDDLPAPVSGVITLPTGLYIQKAPVNFGTNTIDITGSTVQWRTEDSFNHTITYEGTGTFINSSDVSTWRTFDPGLTFVFSGDGATFIDVIGSVGLQFITIFFTHANGGHLGTVTGSFTGILTQGRFFWVSSGVEGWVTGLNIMGTGRSYADTGTITSHANATGGFLNIKDPTAIINLSRLEFVINSVNASAINIDATVEAPVNIERCIQSGVGDFFQVGTTGTFTAVADASISATAITSVTDSSGTARFNFTGPTVFVNQKVVISGFTTNTDYNGTFLITSTDGTTQFEISGIDFGSNETGSFLSDSITLTDTATTLVDGDTILIDTNLSTDYDGGSEVYNKLTNSVQVNKAFVATEIGTWDTGGLTQTSRFVNSRENGDQPDDQNIATAFVNDNTTANGTIVNNVFTDMTFGTAGAALIPGSTIELWKLIDEINGTFEFTGINFDGKINYDFTTESNGGTRQFRFKMVRSSNAEVSNSFIDFADSNPDRIFNQFNDFLTAGFKADDQIEVSGSTSNDGTYTIASVSAGVITLVGSDTLVNEASGAAVTITALFGDLPDNVEGVSDIGSNEKSASKTFPLKAVRGDQIKPQITRTSGTSTVITTYATIFATQ